MEPVDIFARLLGVFYALGGAFTLRAVAGDAVLDKALSAISLTPPEREDVIRRWLMTGAGMLTGLSGLALLMLSGWAAPLFLLNLALQAVWLVWGARRDAADPDEGLGRRRRINAAVLWTGATALVLWLGREHRLLPLVEPWTPALLALAAVGGLAWVFPHLTWNPTPLPRMDPAWDGGPVLPRPGRVRLQLRYGYLPLQDADSGYAVNTADHLPDDLAARIVTWENTFYDAVDPHAPDAGPAFSLEQARAHRDEGLAIAAALEVVFGPGAVDAPLYEQTARTRLLPDADAP